MGRTVSCSASKCSMLRWSSASTCRPPASTAVEYSDYSKYHRSSRAALEPNAAGLHLARPAPTTRVHTDTYMQRAEN